MKAVALLAEQYNPTGRVEEIVPRELEADGWTVMTAPDDDAKNTLCCLFRQKSSHQLCS